MGFFGERHRQVVANATYTPPATTTAQTPQLPTTPVKTEEEVASEGRKKSLLERSRGRFGTILTSFSGVLSPKNENQTSGKKTLLGE